ncbi:hypothetical protein Prum_098710 [Phytohabitans rumicis]|uniref:Uncharacterized protein n=1 Tax=Phytohabitans rumicis TaxID=1076125 RepID=A0A6V8LNJ7_9ACTN|nr:hypothetical protein Prum_098710 [Phytohabitans rumicis]
MRHPTDRDGTAGYAPSHAEKGAYGRPLLAIAVVSSDFAFWKVGAGDAGEIYDGLADGVTDALTPLQRRGRRGVPVAATARTRGGRSV